MYLSRRSRARTDNGLREAQYSPGAFTPGIPSLSSCLPTGTGLIKVSLPSFAEKSVVALPQTSREILRTYYIPGLLRGRVAAGDSGWETAGGRSAGRFPRPGCQIGPLD